MNTLIVSALLAIFVPSPEVCSAQYPVQYSAGRASGFSLASRQFGTPVNCDTASETAATLTEYATVTIERSQLKPPSMACTFFGVGEAVLEAVDAALVQCQGPRDQ